MDLIRYNKSPVIETAKRNDLKAGDLINGNYSISASFNPFLRGKLDYWIKHNGKKHFFAKQNKKFLINFEEMYNECTQVIFLTYLLDIKEKKEKFLILKSPYPACFYEMEIRFVFKDRKTIRLVEIDDKNCLEIAKKTSFISIAEKTEKLEERYDFSELNYLSHSKELELDIGKKFREVIELIDEYDKKIINFVRNFNMK